MTQPIRACPLCGEKTHTRAVDATCWNCRRYTNITYNGTHALPAGQWVRRGLIQVYEVTPPVVPVPPRELPRSRKNCGTIGGHKMHIRAHETPCEDCRQAKATYSRNWNRRWRLQVSLAENPWTTCDCGCLKRVYEACPKCTFASIPQEGEAA